MNTPPLLLGSSLIFWGWLTGWPVISLIAAFILESSRLLPWRWNLETRLLHRVWDLCAVLLLAVFLLTYASGAGFNTAYGIARLFPLVLFPIMLAQAYGARQEMPMSVFFLLLRKRGVGRDAQPGTTINISHAYLAVCILAASLTDFPTPWFFSVLSLLLAWALWPVRSQRFSLVTWAGLSLFLIITGYAGGVGLHKLQGLLEQKFVGMYGQFLMGDMDPFKARTAIGEIGTLKLSNGILLRVRTEGHGRGGRLLTQAVYNVYRGSSWLAIGTPFKPLEPMPGGRQWRLRKDCGPGVSWTVSAWLRRGQGVLSLPNGACRIAGPLLGRLYKNSLGAVKIQEGPFLITYRVGADSGPSLQGPPDAKDLRVPPKLGPVLSRISAQLDLTDKSETGVLKTVRQYFKKNFTYSLNLTASGRAPLKDFLLHTRSGHCEYFATAATLLLRQAGIPSRYAVGYLVHEYSRLEKSFVARGRDAHAWTLVHVHGKWVVVDTTPDVWVQRDAGRASLLEPVLDLGSRLRFLFSQWRWNEGEDPFRRRLLPLLILVIFFLVWRITSRAGRKSVVANQGKKVAALERPPALDFSRIEERFRGFGLGRYPGETPCQWLERVKTSNRTPLSTDSLQPLLALYYRDRFDPEGISPREKISLKRRVNAWLRYNERKGNTPPRYTKIANRDL